MNDNRDNDSLYAETEVAGGAAPLAAGDLGDEKSGKDGKDALTSVKIEEPNMCKMSKSESRRLE